MDPSAGLVSASRGVDEGEPPLELAVVGARPLDVEQVAGLADAVQEAVVAQLPAMSSLDRSCMVNLAIWVGSSKGKTGKCLLFHLLGEVDVEDLVLLAPEQHYFLQPR
jgi:hypothetical protein